METPPNEKKLRAIPFAAHAARGLIRDQKMRRKTMCALLVVALVMLFVGSTILTDQIDPHQHARTFVLYWLACAWLTLTALLLALFDVLMVRAQGRAARRTLAERMK